MPGRLTIRRVRRYRKARYPSRRAQAHPAGRVGRRALFVAVPAAGLAAASGCTTDGAYQPGDFYTRYLLQEDEAREIILDEVRAATGSPADACEHPTLLERLEQDQPFLRPSVAGYPAVEVEVDLLAPAIDVPAVGSCPGGSRPAVGFEFLTDADVDSGSTDPRAFGEDEVRTLEHVRYQNQVGIDLLDAHDFAYVADPSGAEYHGRTRAEAEQLLRDAVRALLDDLRRDGLL